MQRFLHILVLLAVVSAAGCRSHPTVVAPPAPAAERSATVYLAHYDFFHTSLVVPRPEQGDAVEYTYADWDVLANDRRTSWTKAKAILLPSRGTLGRAQWPWDGASDESLRVALDKSWKLSRYRVDTGRLERLTTTLDARFAAAQARSGDVENGGMLFVKAPRPYSLLHNCNHALREWLIDLGFRVPRGVALADFQTPGAVHTFAPGREHHGMVTDFNALVGKRPDALDTPATD